MLLEELGILLVLIGTYDSPVNNRQSISYYIIFAEYAISLSELYVELTTIS
jgi:hypothetical protein